MQRYIRYLVGLVTDKEKVSLCTRCPANDR